MANNDVVRAIKAHPIFTVTAFGIGLYILGRKHEQTISGIPRKLIHMPGQMG